MSSASTAAGSMSGNSSRPFFTAHATTTSVPWGIGHSMSIAGAI
jgi:hypothetical protein